MSDYLERAEEARERNEGLEYEEWRERVDANGLTRSEAYAEGFREGQLWARGDIASGVRVDPGTYPTEDNQRAQDLGRMRGYRYAWAQHESVKP